MNYQDHDLGNQNLFSLNIFIFIGPHWWNSDYLDFLSHQRKPERARCRNNPDCLRITG